jgi:hypothetical protein
MFQRFTERARGVIARAQDEALRVGDESVNSEHILFGLLREDEGVAKARPGRAAPQRSRDPRETLLAHLARQRDPTLDMSTVRILKERARPERRVFAVTFQAGEDEWHLWFAEVRRTPDGSWSSQAASGGRRPAPARAGRWIHLEGWSEASHFCLGGELLREAEGCEARLALPDGTELIDDVSNGVVLFLAERALEQPAVVRLYDSAGALIASQPAF